MASLAQQAVAPPRGRWPLARAYRAITPAEGWATVLLLAIVLLATAWTVTRTEVAPDGLSVTILAIGGMFTGLILAKASAPDLLAHLCGLLTGVAASVVLAVERMPLAPGGRLARWQALADMGAGWLARVQSGAPLDDPRLLAIMLGAAIWLVSYTAAWVLFRRGWLTTALALPLVIALANLGYAPDEGTLPLLVIVLAGTLLAARHAAYRRQIEWSRAHLPYPRRTVSRFVLGGVAIALLVGTLAWTLPMSSRESIFGGAWDRISEPLAEVSQRWGEVLARFAGQGTTSGGSYSAFGESFRLGGHLQLTDDPVMLLAPEAGAMRPAYLAGQRYDAYDGHGWSTTVDNTFQEVGLDGKRYSPRMSFATGQGIHLSPEVSTDRSQVEVELTVIRPKGNLLFTLDTYLTADRQTNVQLPWVQLNVQPYSLAPDARRELPLNLQRMGALLGNGQFAPSTAGGESSPLPDDPALAAEIQAERDALLTRFLTVRWDVGPDGHAQTLYATGQIPIYDDVEAVFSQGEVIPGDAYTVTGLTSTANEDELRAAGTDYPAWVSDRYLELPGTTTARTRELAQQLAADKTSPFDTAKAVEEYVRTTIAYNEDVEPPPANQDVVDYVLFDSLQGYCEYYASAMTVLLRAEGIPARVVGGYFPAPFDPLEGGHLYREKNAHLWVEAFFPGYGWIPFEPTANRDELSYGDIVAQTEEPAAPTPEPTPPPAEPEATPAPPPEEPPAAEQSPNPTWILSDPARLAGWIGLALAAALAAGVLLATSAWFTGFRGLSPVAGLYARAMRVGSWLGVQPLPTLTPREYAERIGRAVPSAQSSARVVADLYTEERYAGRRPDGDAVRAAKSAWGTLRGIAIGSLWRRDRGGSGR